MMRKQIGSYENFNLFVPPGFTIVEPWIRSRSLLAWASRAQNPVISRGAPITTLIVVKKPPVTHLFSAIYRGYNSIYISQLVGAHFVMFDL